jgi:hypothetical protein
MASATERIRRGTAILVMPVIRALKSRTVFGGLNGGAIAGLRL